MQLLPCFLLLLRYVYIFSCTAVLLKQRFSAVFPGSISLFLEAFCLSFMPMLRYTPAARLSEVVYDSTLVTFTYDDASGTVKTIHLTHNGFSSSIRYRQTGVFKHIPKSVALTLITTTHVRAHLVHLRMCTKMEACRCDFLNSKHSKRFIDLKTALQ